MIANVPNSIIPAGTIEDLERAVASIRAEREFLDSRKKILDELETNTIACLASWKAFAGVGGTSGPVSAQLPGVNGNGHVNRIVGQLATEIVNQTEQADEVSQPIEDQPEPVERRRLRNGEGLQRINDLYDTLPDETGLSAAEIARRADIPWSTGRNILHHKGSGYVERDGLWYRE